MKPGEHYNPTTMTWYRDRPAPGYRQLRLHAGTVDAEARTVKASLSSEQPVRRWFGEEVLAHGRENVDLSRAADGLPLLFNHDTRDFIGNVTGIHADGERLSGVMQFSRSARATDVMNDIADGLLANVSIGYDIQEMEETPDGYRATRWQPMEVSIAPVPADATVGIGRNYTATIPEGATMPAKSEDQTNEVRQAEETRIADIRAAFAGFDQPKHLELLARMVSDGATAETAKGELLALIRTDAASTRPVITTGDRSGPTVEQRMEESIACRAGIETDKEKVRHCREHNDFGGLSMVELARAWLASNNLNARGGSREIVGRAFTTRQQDTAAFPELLANVAFKSLLMAYDDAPETWRPWCRTSALNDFKINHRVNLSEFENLPLVPESGTYSTGVFSDLGERIQLATYGKLASITRESLINDDLSAFTRIPTAMGLAAARVVGDLAYGVLTTNANMNQDGFPLFDSVNHKNDVIVGTPPDADSVQAGKVAMALQQGPQGLATLGIRPMYGLCPVGLEGVFNTLMQAQYNPASTSGTLEPNVVQGLLTVISDHRLDTHNPLQWYMAAGTNAWDTVEMAFLDGNQQPYQEQRQDDITNDSITYKVRIDVAAAANDFRGLYRNPGEDLTP